ncbi:hypothetical protein [Dolosigranulum pigrum]|uniref:hypothetical protein n=1 Tax=Dolosigranulum pigrum TaxID=29394 RepID=UPI0015ECA53A|nr:hypothetical protein [Dolosigranulum pigrum]
MSNNEDKKTAHEERMEKFKELKQQKKEQKKEQKKRQKEGLNNLNQVKEHDEL